jgi:tetratricopeptide (TPR) repeat protein
MKSVAFALTFCLALSISALAQHSVHKTGMVTKEQPATPVPGLGSHRHPVSTKNPLVQKFFDQGLTFVWAFNHDEAIRSFKRAAQLDPHLAMAYWGIALAFGPNINQDVDAEREAAAYEAEQKALSLAANASPNERAYINALAKRYSIDRKADLKKLSVDYKNAMSEVARKYPDDLDAATLYAEAAMDLRPWNFWTADGRPNEGTEEIVALLESVLRRNPNHPGANHYYIHAVEASHSPERALPSARRLQSLVPGAGHLVHMPAHIFMRTGDYRQAALSNDRAAGVDEAYFRLHPSHGIYPMGYYTHNLHFLAVANSMEGRLGDARRAAQRLVTYVAPHLNDPFMETMLPMSEQYMPTTILVLSRFHQWRDVLALPQPEAKLPSTNGLWHFGRGWAFAAEGSTEKAEQELKSLLEAKNTISPEAMMNLNKAGPILSLAEKFLNAKIAEARKQNQTAIQFLEEATKIEDSLAYDEPPGWYIPSREALGGVLLRDGQWERAERAFRADLEKNKLNGRSLFGLMEALKAQRKTREASLVGRQYAVAWRNADTKLTIAGL